MPAKRIARPKKTAMSTQPWTAVLWMRRARGRRSGDGVCLSSRHGGRLISTRPPAKSRFKCITEWAARTLIGGVALCVPL